MIGSFLTRGLVMVFGYAYPAYECYKTVEQNKLGIEQLRFWCQYWILVAVLTVTERIGGTFISWLIYQYNKAISSMVLAIVVHIIRLLGHTFFGPMKHLQRWSLDQ